MSYQAFLDHFGAINDLLGAHSVLHWDALTMMPAGGVRARGRQRATLTVTARDLLVSEATRCLLDAADSATGNLPEDAPERRALAQTREAIAFHERVPSALQHRRTTLMASTYVAWAEARERGDFAAYQPHLEQTLALTREIADTIGWSGHPYDALVNIGEPGESRGSLKHLFGRLRAGLRPILEAVMAAPAPRTDFLERDYPEEQQRRFSLKIAQKIGYDLDRGRLDPTVHPFAISFGRDDVRITTRYYRNFLPASIFGTLHETGHALYEMGVDAAYERTPLATDMPGLYPMAGTSFGAHESQSRLWENHVGRSRRFWALHFGPLRDLFPEQLADVDDEAFHRAVNRIKPGFIRVEADELTYDFHIMLRVELEEALINGDLAVKDLPGAWKEIMKRDLGVDVPNDRLGVLQDVHWSSGYIGTFCSYTIGNVMAAQLLETAHKDPAIEAGLEAGNYTPLREWLIEHVHRHGRRFSRDELLIRATGRALDPEPYLAYLRGKYATLYGFA
ncbi:MAG TPA: carboxypeptidase M32 [Aliidongia sp.]|nr:carboxypeptidase M32 [Aliidongia sp.]